MNNRLLEIIRYKTGGKQTEFASLMGSTIPVETPERREFRDYAARYDS